MINKGSRKRNEEGKFMVNAELSFIKNMPDSFIRESVVILQSSAATMKKRERRGWSLYEQKPFTA